MFSRFEFAVKRAGFVKGKARDEPDIEWDRFANELGEDFLDQVTKLVPDFIDNSPERQVFRNGGLTFSKCQKIQSSHELLGALRRVRNNLFHGGKFPEKPIRDRSRDERFLKQAILLIDFVLDRHSCVRNYFEDALE